MWLLLAAAAHAASDDPVVAALETELDRTLSALRGEEAAPYFLGYRVLDERRIWVTARYGARASRSDWRGRGLDVDARIGTPELDSTHVLRGDGRYGLNRHVGEELPITGADLALRAAIWNATTKEVSDARERWGRVQADQVVRVEDEDPSPDFGPAEPVVDLRDPRLPEVDLDAWEERLTAISARLDAHPDVHRSQAQLFGHVTVRYLVNSEGTRIREPRHLFRVALTASTVAEDGAELELYRWRDVRDPAALPDAATLARWADELREDLVEIRAAPDGDAYSGPVLLRGKAAGVFVHEVLGHRVEAHRLKDPDEGHTFKDKVGQRILPEGIDVWDDPTLAELGGEQLNGHYAYDDEGVPAQRAVIVEDGVFRGFLTSRSPVEGFPRSNGHGRSAAWEQPVSRMANLVVEARTPTPEAELRRRLVAEAKAQGRAWALVVDEIDGGFTLTGRLIPNAFNVLALTAWKVYVDGRPDERVRNVDLVGTPLVALSNVAAAGGEVGVFNGYCGAESGFVPVSAASPALLLRTLEVQKPRKGSDRPPLLPKPSPGGDS